MHVVCCMLRVRMCMVSVVVFFMWACPCLRWKDARTMYALPGVYVMVVSLRT